MCVAPDYLLVHESVKEKMIDALSKTIHRFFGEKANLMPHYGKIINSRQFERILVYLKEGRIVCGGNYDRNELFIAPTVMDEVNIDGAIMKEEIFGPVLPVIGFKTKEEAISVIERNKNPLAFYVFTTDKKKEEDWLRDVSFGGGCVNNASWHLTNHHLPFGGRGFSGMGQYQGKFTFDTFSHNKSILKTPNWFDPTIKYPPYKGKLKLFKWMMK
jgi:aldehyde dehydrogenase (NAD+)